MQTAVVLLTLICYGVAAYLWWQEQTPHYLLCLLGGHVSALLSPLWVLLYGVTYHSTLGTLRDLFGQPLYRDVVVGAAWFYPLPALCVFFLYQRRWWFPGYITGLFTYILLLLYHLIVQALGTRFGVWRYTLATPYPFGLSPSFIAAVMAALVSLGLVYTLLLTQRYAWQSALIVLLPAPFVLSLLVHGLLGASLWVPLLLDAPLWATMIGLLATVALLLWAIHLGAWSLGRIDRRFHPAVS